LNTVRYQRVVILQHCLENKMKPHALLMAGRQSWLIENVTGSLLTY